jgi:hypothetical protein
MKSHVAELQHGWMSSVAKAESYNETFLDTEKVSNFKSFLKCNPDVGNHFNRKMKENDADDKDDDCRMYEMKRKSLTRAFLTHEMISELQERNLNHETFGPKISENSHITFMNSADSFMQKVDNLRKSEIYSHDKCSKACADRGCKWVMSADGNWKLRYAICMWDTQYSYPTELQDYLPNACSHEPKIGQAFCKEHCEIAAQLGKPTELSAFIQHCGVDPDGFTKEGKAKMGKVLSDMSKHAGKLDSTLDDSQGTSYLLRNSKIANKENFSSKKKSEGNCHKDIGEKYVHKKARSRGVFMTVTGGGIIRNWAPLYKSEGPTQVGLLLTGFLHTYLGHEIPNHEEWNDFFLSYDNMCHVDELRLLNSGLELPEPYNKMWSKINKVIDPLHVKNPSPGVPPAQQKNIHLQFEG